MKKTLIVSAHPLEKSLCNHLADFAQKCATENGHEVTHRRLCEVGFDPRITASERGSYYAEAFDHSSISEELAELTEASTLILVFPTWWFGFPAILKGWFDRVWAPGYAFDHATDLSAIKPRLNNLENVIAVTTMGSPWWVDWLLLRRPVRRVLKTALIGVCAPQAKLLFKALYRAEKLQLSQIERFKRSIQIAVNKTG